MISGYRALAIFCLNVIIQVLSGPAGLVYAAKAAAGTAATK
jgi:hypothetical protein